MIRLARLGPALAAAVILAAPAFADTPARIRGAGHLLDVALHVGDFGAHLLLHPGLLGFEGLDLRIGISLGLGLALAGGGARLRPCGFELFLQRFQVALLRFGLTVEVASTFRRGLAVSLHRPPFAILLDEALPDLDATQLHDRLEANHATAAIPIVKLAQGDATDAAQLAIELGGPRPAPRRWPIEERVIEGLRAQAIL